MNITFLLGNGFDINLGLNTRYKDFYKYYTQQPSKNVLIEELKNNIGKNHKTWADLEIALGDYLKNIRDADDFDVIFEDILEHLAVHIENEEGRFTHDLEDKKEFYLDLAYPESHLLELDKQKVNRYLKDENRYLNIITFNYTKVLERLCGFESEPISLPRLNTREARLMGIKHIHGYLKENMILGVNDISQINNEEFKTNPDITEAIVKQECNMSIKHLIHNDCMRTIRSSDMICLFGLSIGDTDKIWWKSIGSHLHDNSKAILIIFEIGDNLLSNHQYKITRKEREIKTRFLSKLDFPDSTTTYISERIFVAYNTKIFNIKLKEKKE